MIEWLQVNMWLWSSIIAICAIITLLIKMFGKKTERDRPNQTVSNNNNSTINQAVGDIHNAK